MPFRIVLAIAAIAACTQLAAQEKSPSQANHLQLPYESEFWRYVSVSAGRSAYDFECQHDTQLPCDEKDNSAFKVAVGGRFTQTFGMEIGYVDLGDVSLPRLQGRTRARGLDLSLVAAATVFDRVGINARIGAVYGWTRSQLRDASITCILGEGPQSSCDLSKDDHGFDLTYGAGLSVPVARRVELRLDWDRYRMSFVDDGDFHGVGGKRDIDLWSAGLNFVF